MQTKTRFTTGMAAAWLIAFLLSTTPSFAGAEDEDLAPKLRGALVKVHITNQSYDAFSPWKKSSPRGRSQRGVVIRPGLILTLSYGMVDHLMIEVSEANSARRYPASLSHVDYSAGLALVAIEDEDLLSRTAPMTVGPPITIDDEFEVWQLGGSDLLERFTGRVQKVFPAGNTLRLTVKTNLADTGDGQIALKDGKVVGLVTQTRSSRQEGQLLAVETIKHYLEDFDSGDYKGFPGGGIWWHNLLRDDLRALYGVPEGVHGLAISHVVPGRTGYGAIEVGDVLTHVAGKALDDEGMFKHDLHGRLHVRYLIDGVPHPGESIGAQVLRKGEVHEVEIPIRSWPRDEQLVPANLYDRRAQYMVVGGMVILELIQRIGTRSELLRRYQSRANWDPPGERKRIVYASRIMPDASNKGLDTIRDNAILKVNGKRITRIQDVAEALKAPVDGYHVFTFEEIEKNYVIMADELEEIDRRLAERYKIPELRHLE